MDSVSVFIPCLVDQVYPEIGRALVRLLRHLGFEVRYNEKITCCGQPAFNAGQLPEARRVARNTITELLVEGDCPKVCPSGSCTAMVRQYYPDLFKDTEQAHDACRAGEGVFELGEFLEAKQLLPRLVGRFSGKVGFHNSCHTARELGQRSTYQRLFAYIQGVELVEPSPEPVCCGFGGLFCQKFDTIAGGMAKTRLEQFQVAGAERIVSNDPGCIMHLRLQAEKLGVTLPIQHTAEFLVGAMGLA